MLINRLQRCLCALLCTTFISSFAFAEVEKGKAKFDMGEDFWQHANSKVQPLQSESADDAGSISSSNTSAPEKDAASVNTTGPDATAINPTADAPSAAVVEQSTSNNIIALPPVTLPNPTITEVSAPPAPTIPANISPAPQESSAPNANLDAPTAAMAPEVQLPSPNEMQKLQQSVKDDIKPGPKPDLDTQQLQPVSLPNDPSISTESIDIKKQEVGATEPIGHKLDNAFTDLEHRTSVPLSTQIKSPASQGNQTPEDASQTAAIKKGSQDQDAKESDAATPVSVSTDHKNADANTPHFAIPMPLEDDDKDEYLELDLSPREVYDYRTTVLPSSISKKQYDPENQHLPKVFYQDEYTKLLFIAAAKDDIGGVKALLMRGADINAQDSQKSYTPLMYAVANNKLQTARYLIARGADLDIGTYEGQNALHIACKYNHSEMVKLLITAGLDPTQGDHNGTKPLSLLTGNQDVVALQMLSTYKDMDTALLGCASMNSFSCVQHALNRGAKINTKNKQGDTPLIIAANNNNLNLVNLLINYGADARIVNKQNYDAAAIAKHNDNKMMSDIIETSKIKKDISGYAMEEYNGLGNNVQSSLPSGAPSTHPETSVSIKTSNAPKSLFTKKNK